MALKRGVDQSTNPFLPKSACVFMGQNTRDGDPSSSPGIEIFNVSELDDYKAKFSLPREEKLKRPILNKTHMIWEGNGMHFNSAAILAIKKFDPDHWSLDNAGILGHVIFFNK